MQINEALQLARETRGYGRTEFGRLLGVATAPNSYVQKYEEGKREPGVGVIEKWFRECGCVPSYDGVGWSLRFSKKFEKKVA